jgi:hypothetical protein
MIEIHVVNKIAGKFLYLPLVCLLLIDPPLVLLELVLYGENWFRPLGSG